MTSKTSVDSDDDDAAVDAPWEKPASARVDLRSLRHVVVLSRVLSFTRASEQLGVTQSALSRSIQAFERRWKVRLFDRDRGRVHLTQVGRAFAERAASLLREARDLEQLVARKASAEVGQIAYGMSPLVAKALLPSMVERSLAAYPELHNTVAVRNAPALLTMLVTEEIEFFVCSEGQIPKTAPTKSVFLGWFPISLIVRAGHPILSPSYSRSEQRFPVLLSARLGDIRNLPVRFRRYLNGVQHAVEDYGVLASITEHSDAIWVTSPFAAMEEIRQQRLQEVPVPGAQRTTGVRIMMYGLDRRTLSPAALRIRLSLQEEIRALST